MPTRDHAGGSGLPGWPAGCLTCLRWVLCRRSGRAAFGFCLFFSFLFCLAGISMSPLPLPEFTPLEHTACERQGGRKNLSRSQEASVSEEISPKEGVHQFHQ